MPNVVYLKISSQAQHLYGKLYWGREPAVQLTYRLTEDDAESLNENDFGFTSQSVKNDPEMLQPWESVLYKAGDKSTRFLSEELLVELAKSSWKSYFPHADSLVLPENL